MPSCGARNVMLEQSLMHDNKSDRNMNKANKNVLFGQFGIFANMRAPLGDSDTDSGICADSDNQISPRRNSLTQLEHTPEYRFKQNFQGTHLRPESAWNLHGYPEQSSLTLQKRLRERPQTSCSTQTAKSAKQYRVRFADQVSTAGVATDDSTSTSSCGWQNSDSGLCADYPDYCINLSNKNEYQRRPMRLIGKELGRAHRDYHRFDDFYSDNNSSESPATQNYTAPPTTGLRRTDDWYNSATRPYGLARRYQNRSASLPRGLLHQTSIADGRRASADHYTCHDYQLEQPHHDQPYHQQMASDDDAVASGCPENFLARNVESLSLVDRLNNSTSSSGRQLPQMPTDAKMTHVRQTAFNRQRRAKSGVGIRSQSVGRNPLGSEQQDGYSNRYREPLFYRSPMTPPPVHAQLIALDHRGFRTVLIKKLQPGPFGFYIANGILNQKRGIFISRVSLPSLAPVLSVGDEIICVEDEWVRGHHLEYVQSLIAGKLDVRIVLLPSVQPTSR